MKRKAMISQPMAGKTEMEIAATRKKALAELESKGYEIVNTLFTDDWLNPDNSEERRVINRPLMFVARSLMQMSLCDAVYFCRGWETARGCRLEHTAAIAYGVGILYEEDDT